MNTKQLVEETFLAPFAKPGREYVGVELEFPLLNLAKAPVDKQVACGLMTHLLEHGFQTSERDMDGNPAFLVNQDGDELSFDNSYNNFEFAMAKGKNLSCIANRFYHWYRIFCFHRAIRFAVWEQIHTSHLSNGRRCAILSIWQSGSSWSSTAAGGTMNFLISPHIYLLYRHIWMCRLINCRVR